MTNSGKKKAFDKNLTSFTVKTLSKLGLKGNFSNLIMDSYRKTYN